MEIQAILEEAICAKWIEVTTLHFMQEEKDGICGRPKRLSYGKKL
jgi:hypothetical protein